MAEASVTALIPRPPGVPEDIDDGHLMVAVREYMLGEKAENVADSLGINKQKLQWIIKTPQWRLLQNQFAAEFIATTGSRMVRLESMVLAKLEDQIENGIETMSALGERYTRQLAPKELVAVALMLDTQNKRLDKLKEGDVDRKKFDSAELMRRFEGVARKLNEKEIPGEATRAE